MKAGKITMWSVLVLVIAAVLCKSLPAADAPPPSAETFKQYQTAVEEITKSKFDKPVEFQETDKEGMREVVSKQVAEYKQTMEVLLEAMGLFMPEVDSISVADALKAYSDFLMGVYIPGEGKYYYLKGGDKAEQAEIAVHELTHAMQDQQINLKQFFKFDPSNLDKVFAYKAVAEGEATCVQMEYGMRAAGRNILTGKVDVGQQMQLAMDMKLSGRSILGQSVGFPYVYGGAFYQRYLQKYGWGKTANLYKTPPVSTEQILHPEKYLDQVDYPVGVNLTMDASALGKGWEQRLSTVLGEYWTLGLLSDNQPDLPAAWKAMIGWDGDRWIFFRNAKDNSRAAVAVTTWDSRQDAREFFAFIKAHIIKRWAKELAMAKANNVPAEQKHSFVVRREGKKVLVAINIPRASRENVMAALEKAEFKYSPDDKDQGANDEKTTRLAEKTYLEKFKPKDKNLAVAENGTVTDKDKTVSFVLPPEDWRAEKDDMQGMEVLKGISKAFPGGNIGMSQTSAAGAGDVKDVVEQVKNQYTKVFKDVKVLEEKSATLDGIEGRELSIELTASGAVIRMTQIIVIRDGTVYTITYASSAKSFAEFEAVAKKVVASFKFLSKGAGGKD